MPPTPVRVVPLPMAFPVVAGQQLHLLSAEVWDAWWDLRFARVDVGDDAPLHRRVPPPSAWDVSDDLGNTYDVIDAVGRGDRSFSNGEVRLRPTLDAAAAHLEVTVDFGGQLQRANVAIAGR